MQRQRRARAHATRQSGTSTSPVRVYHLGPEVRSGQDYRAALRDGRRVWVVGEGLIEDVTSHSATRGMVDEYVAWYDLHRDPAWADAVLTPDGVPYGAVIPHTSAD